ncbi:MAG: hypothetical protein ACTH3D_02955, partial [Halomonas sp.]|uniref:hypothetical protein n=1 Tax=Halomonas sp. TaxID=1486246 RepID=UPI003F8EEFC8
MTEQAPAHLISQLERRTQRLVDDLDETRCQLAAAQAHHTLLEQKVQALEAQRYELQEACRGLSEQNEALESHSRHLQERLEQSDTQQPLSRHTRQSRGLSALLGQNRAAPHTPDAKPELVAEPAADTATTPEPDAKPESIARSEPTVTSEPVTAEPVTAEPVKPEPVKP